MTHSSSPVAGRLAALLVAAAVVSSCTSEKIAYKTASAASPPPAAAANFLGYQDTLTKQTVCGNCHADQQAAWAQTHHANAWSDLQATGHATAACQPCHTVDSYGNATKDTLVGFAATSDPRYHDVQCESCHGPGLVHASGPSLANLPLASINVDTGGVPAGTGCGECHNGLPHNPFLNEWIQSEHASSVQVSTTSNCQNCHTGQGALNTWGINTNYVEDMPTSAITKTNAMDVTCAVCHDPHGGPNPYQLRYPINVADTSKMLCMRCHQRNPTPAYTSGTLRASMSPEGPVLLGIAGYWPPGYTGPTTITLTHGTPSANPGLCVTCHMNPVTVDSANGALANSYTGHMFVAAPCLDAMGNPTTATCAITQRDFSACAASGCHASPSVASGLMSTVITRLALLDSALSSQVVALPKAAFTNAPDTTVITVAFGAKFNLLLAEKVGEEIHNPFLMEALLTSSIQAVQTTYGVAPKISVNLANILPAIVNK